MREILFRGQTRKNGQKVYIGTGEKVPGHWVYGGILQGTGDYSIIYGGDAEKDLGKHVVYSETVGQYTGLKDKNGKKVFEGDIVRKTNKGRNPEIFIANIRTCFYKNEEVYYGPFEHLTESYEYEIIGNIYDNPEFMKEGAD